MTALNPNRYAGPTEATLLREDIAADIAAHSALVQRVVRAQTALHDAKDTLRAAQEAFESAQRIHDHVTQLEHALVERVRVSRGFLHPIRRLPDELLVMIFLDVDRYHDRRLRLSAAYMCQHWRSVALHTPQLWEIVDCPMFDVADAATERIWTFYIQMHLERSATRPLSVSIQYYLTCPEPPTPGLWSTFSALLRRARSFTFSTSVDVTRALATCLAVHAPDLVTLDISDAESDICSTSVLCVPSSFNAPRLETFKHNGSELTWALSDVFRHVVRINLSTETFKTQHLLDLFERFPNVRSLNLLAGNSLTSSVPFVVRAEHLRTLDITILPGFMDLHVAQSFEFPSLREAHITIEAALDWDAFNLGMFMHSALSKVTVLTLHMDVGFGVASGIRSCPQVESSPSPIPRRAALATR